jgi:hypothetical protein
VCRPTYPEVKWVISIHLFEECRLCQRTEPTANGNNKSELPFNIKGHLKALIHESYFVYFIENLPYTTTVIIITVRTIMVTTVKQQQQQ